ncbi:MAG: hypothetical protein H7138_01095, partial [Myxococcales bacterium]|nr:hypothetical protein [Myxococcales bacterium]
MAIVASGVFVSGVARADEDPLGSARAGDPFAMLQERERAWTFELTTGASLAALATVKNAPRARCQVAEVTTVGALRRSVIACAPVAEAEGDVAAALAQRFTLVFDDAGVREVVRDSEDVAELEDGSNAGAFTFPRAFGRRWQHDVRRPDIMLP